MIKYTLSISMIAGLLIALPLFAETREHALVVNEEWVYITEKPLKRITINGSLPGPTLEFNEGDEAIIHVSNTMNKPTSVHWHGLLLPGQMDGVPGLNGFSGIKPGETFTYRFKIRQNGTYWYHAHSAGQEQDGHYGSIIIHPKDEAHIKTARDYVVLFSDFHEDDADTIIANLKRSPEYYVYIRRTVGDFFTDAEEQGLAEAWENAKMWGKMRMMPTDLADVGNYTFLVNGKTPEQNWTGLFNADERIRLRFINASAMSFYDVRIPGLKMTMVAADGQAIEPVVVDEFRFGVAETYDAIVQPQEDKAYTIVGEAIDRTGFALATLAPREGMRGEPPRKRKSAMLTMADMGMAHDMSDMEHSKHDRADMEHSKHDKADMEHSKHDNADMEHSKHDKADMEHDEHSAANMDHSEHAAHKNHTMYQPPVKDFDTGTPGSGWANADTPKGHKALAYKDLRYYGIQKDQRLPGREIIVRLGGNMERYIWTLNGKKYEDAEPIQLEYGERVRLTFINDTMMAHPMHLHGMFVQLENGQPISKLPNKHTVNVAPGDSYSALLTADEAGEWAFHCHLLYHMMSGMMNKVVVAKLDSSKVPAKLYSPKAQKENSRSSYETSDAAL